MIFENYHLLEVPPIDETDVYSSEVNVSGDPAIRGWWLIKD